MGTNDNRASRLEIANFVLRCHNLKYSLSQKPYGEYTNQLIRNINQINLDKMEIYSGFSMFGYHQIQKRIGEQKENTLL